MVSCEVAKSLEERPVLTNREVEILEQVALGLSNKEIARKLGISKQTVKNHLTMKRGHGSGSDGIFARLNVLGRREAVLEAIKWGYLNPLELTTQEERKRCERLSPRESEILTLLLDSSFVPVENVGITTAREMGISLNTLQNHITSINRKLDIQAVSGPACCVRAAVIFLAYQQEQT